MVDHTIDADVFCFFNLGFVSDRFGFFGFFFIPILFGGRRKRRSSVSGLIRVFLDWPKRFFPRKRFPRRRREGMASVFLLRFSVGVPPHTFAAEKTGGQLA